MVIRGIKCGECSGLHLKSFLCKDQPHPTGLLGAQESLTSSERAEEKDWSFREANFQLSPEEKKSFTEEGEIIEIFIDQGTVERFGHRSSRKLVPEKEHRIWR